METKTKQTERTLVILKPDALQRNLVGRILFRFAEAGLSIVARKILYATDGHLDGHFLATKQWVRDLGARARERVLRELGKDPTAYFGVEDPHDTGMVIMSGCRDYYRSGPLMPIVFEGEDAVAVVRRLIGKTLPSKALKGTIRGDFGISENGGELVRGAARNLVHASDSVEEAQREIAVWFSPDELSEHES